MNRRNASDVYSRHEAACRAFAKARGWSLARRPFPLVELAIGRRVNEEIAFEFYDWPRGIDHTTCYTFRGRPISSLSQSYADGRGGPDFVGKLTRAFAEFDVPLKVSTPPEPSWWFPKRAVDVLFEPAEQRSITRGAEQIIALGERIARAFEHAGVPSSC